MNSTRILACTSLHAFLPTFTHSLSARRKPSRPPHQISTFIDHLQSLIAINNISQALVKLNSTNYFVRIAQFNALLIGYDLFGYVDGTLPCSPATIVNSDLDVASPNSIFALWIRHDQLLLNAIIGSVPVNLVTFIASSTSSHATWSTLEKNICVTFTWLNYGISWPSL